MLAWSSNVKSRHGSDHEDEDHTPARESTQGVLFPARVAHALGTAPEGLQELCLDRGFQARFSSCRD